MASRLLIGALIAGALILGLAVELTRPPGAARPLGCEVPQGYILIVADERGFNDSLSHLAANPREPWPVVRARLGETLRLIVCNEDEVATHGFAIEHYLPAGVAIAAHESFKISLLLDKAGNFTIYCTILCPSHPYMLNGLLIVEQ